jgi:hypothetical protein
LAKRSRRTEYATNVYFTGIYRERTVRARLFARIWLGWFTARSSVRLKGRLSNASSCLAAHGDDTCHLRLFRNGCGRF